MNSEQLRLLVIRPTLSYMDNGTNTLGGDRVEDLLLGTCAQESAMGEYLKQKGNGPALGIYQMEPFTHDDIWKNFLSNRLALSNKIRNMIPDMYKSNMSSQLISNLCYATAMTRCSYLRHSEKIPPGLDGLAYYWKKYYNTVKGKGKESEFIKNYQNYIV